MSRRVVVTGVGAMSPFGLGADVLYNALLEGANGITPLAERYELLKPGFGGSVNTPWKEMRNLPGCRALRPSTMTRYTYLATGALGSALENAGLDPETEGPERRGLYVGSSCNMDTMDKYVVFTSILAEREAMAKQEYVIDDSRISEAMKRFTGFDYLKLMNNMPTAHGGIESGAQGPCNTFLGWSVSGLQAIGRAYRAIQDDMADTMMAGGVGSSTHELMLITKGHRGQLCSADADPASASRPFDQSATGQVPGEGGAFLVLEELEHAKARGATILAELCGYGERFSPPTELHGVPTSEAGAATITDALKDAAIKASDVDLVVAGGVGRPDMDRVEAQGIATAFEGATPAWTNVSQAIGYAEAGNGPMGAAVGLLAMKAGRVPGNRTTTQPIEEWAFGSQSEVTETEINTLLVHGAAPRGGHVDLVFRANL